MKKKVNVFLSLVGACVLLGGCAVSPRMDRSKLLVGGYYLHPWLCDEAHIRDASDCGIDFIVCNRVTECWDSLDIFAKYGMGVVAIGAYPTWSGGRGANGGRMREMRPLAMYADRLDVCREKLDHPAIWLWGLCDEPSARDFDHLGDLCRLFAEKVPQAPAYVNLYPNYAQVAKNTGEETVSQLGVPTYAQYVEEYCRKLPLDYLSYDFYVFTNDRSKRDEMMAKMYANYTVAADACRRTGRSLWYIPQVNSYRGVNFEPTSENRLRFQAYTAMAYGAEAITWACWAKGWWTNNVLNAKGEQTAQYAKLHTVNAELHRLGPLYMKYRNVATHLVGFRAEGELAKTGIALPRALDVAGIRGLGTAEGTPLVVGEMVGRSSWFGSPGRALVVVAAGDPFDYAPAKRTVTFGTEGGRRPRITRSCGEIEPVRREDGAWAFELAENDMAIIEF